MIDQNTQEELQTVEPKLDQEQIELDAQVMAEQPQAQVDIPQEQEAGVVSDVARFIGKAIGVQTDAPLHPKVEAPKAEAPKPKESGISAWANREVLKMKSVKQEKKIGEQVQSKPKKLTPKQAKKKFEDNVINAKYGGDATQLTKTEKDIYQSYSDQIAEQDAKKQAQADVAMEVMAKQARQEDILKKLEMGEAPILNSLNVEKEMAGLRASKIDQFNDDVSHIINFDTLDSEEDIVAVIAHMAEQNKQSIDFERRGVVSDDLFKELSDQLGADPKFVADVLSKDVGENFIRPEYVTASIQFLEQSATRLKMLSMKAQESLSPKDKIEFINQWNLHQAFYSKFMGGRAEAGRTLRAFQLTKKMKNENDILATLGAIEHGMDVNKVMKMVGDGRTAEDINKMSAGYRDNWKSGFDLMYTHYMASMLSGTNTLGAIIGGNIGNTFQYTLERAVAPLFPRSKGAMDEVENDEVMAMLIGYLSSARDATKAAYHTLKTGEVYSGHGVYDINMNQYPSEKFGLYKEGTQEPSGVGSFLDSLYKFSTFGLRNVIGSTSSYSTVLSEKAQLNALAYRHSREMLRRGEITENEFGSKLQELVINPTAEMRAEADDYAAHIELRENPGTWLVKLQNLMGATPAARWLVPFVKTMGNTMRQTLEERSIIGLNPYSKFWDDMKAGGSRKQMAMSKMAVGSTYVAMAYMAADNGLITGPLSTDKQERKAQQDAGYQPYSFVFTNADGKRTFVSYQNIEPFHSMFGIAATMNDYFRKASYTDITKSQEQLEMKLMANLIAAVSENTLNRSMGQSLNSIFDILDNADVDGMERMFDSFVNTMAGYSGARRTLTKMTDEYKRNTDGTFQYIQSQIPFLSSSLPPVRDALGREKEHDYTFMRYLPKVVEAKSGIDKEVQYLFGTTRKYALTSVREILGGQKITPEEQERWFKYSRQEYRDDEGRNLEGYLNYIIMDEDYKQKNDYEKVEYIRNEMQHWDITALESIKYKDKDLAMKLDSSEIVKRARDFEHRLGMGIEDALNKAKEDWSLEYESQRGGY